jgi:hypothetical protein
MSRTASIRFFCAIAAAVAWLFVLPASAELKDGLVSYWPFETSTSEYTPDIVNRNDLYFYDMSRSNHVRGKFGLAFAFDGKSQFLALNYSTNKTLPIHLYPEYTVTMWVRARPHQNNRIVFAEGSTTDRVPLFLLGTHRDGLSSSLNVLIRKTTNSLVDNIPSQMPAFNNEWQHIAWVDNDGSAKLYINGVPDPIQYDYQRTAMRLNNLSIGGLLRNPPMYFFHGEIDEVAIWKRTLTESEIRQLLEGPLSNRIN